MVEVEAKNFSHQTVLLKEAVSALVHKKDGSYVDGTFGRGGHSREILENLGDDGQLLAIDKDIEAVQSAENILKMEKRFSIYQASFSEIGKIALQNGLQGKIDGVLLDLGLSSPQLDDEQRGFSFMRDGPLDMRMDLSKGLSAQVWLSRVGEEELANIIFRYGEERYARRIAQAIVSARNENEITRTKQLAEIVSGAIPRWEKHKHPATRTFQAIRIFINDELEGLTKCLSQIEGVLSPGGRLVVISFHSLEDRIVKNYMRDMAKGVDVPSYIPLSHNQLDKKMKLLGKAIKPSKEEIEKNPRARSAVMRVAEKL